VVIIDFADATSQVNALISGSVDVVNLLSASETAEVLSAGAKVVNSPGGGFTPFTMRTDIAPFNDVRVRQAMRLIVDRPAMLELVFGGHGAIGNDVFSIWDPEYDRALPQRHQDLAQAKSLLKAAGHEGLTVSLVTANIAQGTTLMAEVFQQQAKGAGVTVNLQTVTVDEFYGPNYLKWPFAQDFWYYSSYFVQVSEATLPKSPFNECHFANARYEALYSKALATPNLAAQTDIAHEMQKIDYDEGGYIIPFFSPVIDGYASNVQGVVPSKVGVSFNDYDLRRFWLS
jgi:peptide/nickel transport system substrate-binding protein